MIICPPVYFFNLSAVLRYLNAKRYGESKLMALFFFSRLLVSVEGEDS